MSRERWGFGRVYRHRSNGRWYTYVWDVRDRPESVAKALHKPWQQVTEADARRRLKQRLKDKWTGRTVEPKAARMLVRELLDAYLKHLEVKGIKSLKSTRSEIEAVKRWLGDEEVGRLTPLRLTALVAEHLQRGRLIRGQRVAYMPGTVKTRLAQLHAAWTYGADQLGLSPVVKFPELTVDNARQVTISDEEFATISVGLRHADPADEIALLCYLTGWRIGEVLKLEWSRVDRDQWIIRLDTSKNKRGRARPVEEPELRELLSRRYAQRSIGCPALVFHRHGLPVTYGWFLRQWHRACELAGVGDKRPHDCKRSFYRDGATAGVDLLTLMELAGNRSLQVAKRYNVMELQRMTAGVEKLIAYRNRRKNPSRTRSARGNLEGDSPS